MSIEQIKNELVEYAISEYPDSGIEGKSFEDLWYEYIYEIVSADKSFTLPSGELELLEETGGEGQGEIFYIVFKVGDTILEVDGYYNSWEGVIWEDPEPYEVVPEEKIITVYNPKN